MSDLISRQAALEALNTEIKIAELTNAIAVQDYMREVHRKLCALPPAQPEVIYCMDCDWWTKQDDSVQGRCALMGAYPTGWWFCGNARRRTDG